ncbi:MAG: hypothetical protein M0Q38_09505 [Bacteroidales bacterium]|jgi:hypothetical protein|nr:hypothetical protein [Bacteroidales bacterium]
MKRSIIILFIWILVTILFVHEANASTKTFSKTSGTWAWAYGPNWVGGVAPVAGDDVIINPSSTMEVNNVPTIALNSLTIGGSGTVTLTAYQTTHTLTINNSIAASDLFLNGGSLTIGSNLNFTMAAGSYGKISSGRTLTINYPRQFILTAGTTTFEIAGTLANSGTCTLNNVNNTVYYNGNYGQNVLEFNYYNLQFNNNSKTLPIGTVGIAGTFTPGTNTSHSITYSTIYFNGAAQNIPQFNGTTNGYYNLQIGGTGTKTLTANATISGELYLAAQTFNVSAFTLTIKNGPGTRGTGTLISANNGTVIYTGLLSKVLYGTYGNLTMGDTYGRTWEPGTYLISNVFTPGTSTIHTLTGTTLLFNGTSAQYLPSFNGSTGYNSVTINNSSGVSLSGNVKINSTLTLTSGLFSVGANTLTLNGPAIAGTPTNLSTNSSSSLSFGGSSSGVSIPGNVTTLNNLTAGNSSGLALSGNVTVNGSLNFNTDGLITTGSNILSIGASGSISGYNSSRYINGKLAMNYSGSGSKVFPIGKGGNYRPVTFNYSALTGASAVTVEQVESVIPGPAPANTTLFGTRYWSITESGSTSRTYFVTLDGNGFSPTHTVKMIKGDGSTNTAYDVTTPDYTNATGFTTFSNFGLGESSFNPALITVQPSSQTVNYGAPASFNITATGASDYHWQELIGSTWTPITDGGIYSGATTDTLHISAVTGNMNTYQYKCIVQPGNVNSNPVTLSYNPASITVQPSSQTVNYGALASFNITATGASGYHWQELIGSTWTPITDGGIYSGATTDTLHISAVTGNMNTYQYKCIVQPGDVNSNPALLTVTFTVSGVLKYANPDIVMPITNATVFLKTPDELTTIATTTTDISGNYTFFNVNAGSYKLDASTTKPWGGLTFADYLLVKNFVTNGTPVLEGIYWLAADVNNSNSVTFSDYLIIKNRVNTNSTTSWLRPDWIFINTTIDVVNANVTDVAIIGICSGDVNASYSPPL